MHLLKGTWDLNPIFILAWIVHEARLTICCVNHLNSYIYIYTFVNHKFTYLQSSDLNLLTYYLCIMFSRSNITLYQFYSPYSVHEWNCQWIVWWCGHVKLETIKISYTHWHSMKQALVVVHVLCDTVNPYLWNNCDSFKVFEKWGTYLHQMMDISTVNC